MRDSGSRRLVWRIVEVAEPDDRPSWIFDIAIRILIALNVLFVIVETVPAVTASAGPALVVFDIVSVIIFTVEYLARVWSCTADPRYARPLAGRARFVVTPLALVDLIAVLPFWLPMAGVDLRILRGVRLFRLFRILKVARYSRALRTFGRVFRGRSEELILTFAMVMFLVLMASSLLYFAEHGAQPDVFSSIPASMWWGIVTLTTVGYGDVYPITTVGRLFGGVFALSAVMLIALPTAILGAAFVEEIERERRAGGSEALEQDFGQAPGFCPHCGQPLDFGPLPPVALDRERGSG